MHSLLQIWFHWVETGGYLGIIVLMAMESSIFPVPSEMVIPPAAYWAAQGRMSFWGVILAGTFGSWLGSAITYWIARWGGRIFIIKFGRYFFLSEEKLTRAEDWLHRYEAGGIFFARLLPVVRHLISIPAGIVRMNFAVFSAVTVLGSALWCGVLAWFGKTVIGSNPGLLNDPAELALFMKSKSLPLIAGIFIFGVLYFLALKLMAPRGAETTPPA